MVSWNEFTQRAPVIAGVFTRRHAATRNLCFLSTLRHSGAPRISPMEPRVFAGRLIVGGMPGTTKLADLARDPRFELHTATVDTQVSEGDAKVWGTVRDEQDLDLHTAFAEHLYAAIGFDLRGRRFAPFYVADIEGASAVRLEDGHMTVTVWSPAAGEREIRKA
ncbi:pyridoxamine 5'-phosphate oxidase family protein [Mycobacteroides sp. LB1]|uniref:pyridoxamine 5'-phosphate oxidase family protein n=1 Tax=Mycobacteroides sp. LB1 TaxID=2750814 RepID=UPI0015DE2F01|nr:pyridoxamine 5'-phosphate oxidase family protein [Mycobacteroides sp. LB1]